MDTPPKAFDSVDEKWFGKKVADDATTAVDDDHPNWGWKKILSLVCTGLAILIVGSFAGIHIMNGVGNGPVQAMATAKNKPSAAVAPSAERQCDESAGGDEVSNEVAVLRLNAANGQLKAEKAALADQLAAANKKADELTAEVKNLTDNAKSVSDQLAAAKAEFEAKMAELAPKPAADNCGPLVERCLAYNQAQGVDDEPDKIRRDCLRLYQKKGVCK